MLVMRRIPRISANRIRVTPPVMSCAVRCHTHSSSSSSSSSSTIHTISPSKSHSSNSHKGTAGTLPDTTPDTLINLAVNKDVSGILLELENMHNNSGNNNSSCSLGSGDEEEESPSSSSSTGQYEPELAALAANLFFSEKVTTADVTSVEQCCDIFDLLDEKHPVLAQQGYSKLLELSLNKDRLQLVCCLCTRLLSQDIRLGKPLSDSLLSYLTGTGQVEQALALARTIPPSRQTLLALVEPLFLAQQHMEFASLFRQYCLPFNNDTSLTDVNLVVVSMIWAKGLSSPLPEAEREEFVTSIVRSLDAYRAIFHDMASKDPHYSRIVVNKLFRVMQEGVQHVFLSRSESRENDDDENDEEEDTAGIVSDLRRKFVTSRYFSPFPFMPQDCSSSTNFSSSIRDITAQVEEGAGAGAGAGLSPFFLSNYLWQQDYADVINSLVAEREDDSPYYDDSDEDDDSDSDSDEDEEGSGEYAACSDSDDDSSSDDEETEFSINVKIKLPSGSSSSHQSVHKVSPKRIDMEAHLSRGRDDLTHSHQHQHQQHINQEARHDAMKSFISGFQVHKFGQNMTLFEFLDGSGLGSQQHSDSDSADTRCPGKLALCDKMNTLGYVDEEIVEEALANMRLRLGGAGASVGASISAGGADISSQCHGTSNLRLANDLFGYVPPYRFSESAYDSIKFMKDDVNWGPWKR